MRHSRTSMPESLLTASNTQFSRDRPVLTGAKPSIRTSPVDSDRAATNDRSRSMMPS